MQLSRRLATAVTTFLLAPFLLGAEAYAQAPKPWEIGMQPAFSPVKQRIIELHDLLLVIITLITLLVAGLIGWVVYRYNARRNPIPDRVSHHTVLEIAWTVIPVLILVVIAIPSFRLIYYQDRTPDPALTLKVTGHQWYWEYSYPDQGNVDIESRIVADDDLKPGQLRLLTVDNQLVVPAGKNIRVLTTSADVIHSFFIPALGVQRYAIPGRAIETWLRADKPGTYYGECNQICGTNHNRMPIVVRAVTDAEFNSFIEQAKKSAAADPGAPVAARLQTASAASQ